MRILVLTYAFPPLHVQMTPVVLKALAGLRKVGAHLEVVTVRSFPGRLPRSPDLEAYSRSLVDQVHFVDDVHASHSMSKRLSSLLKLPDLMAAFNAKTVAALLDMDLGRFDAVLTFSPFHSINCVMAELKSHRPHIKWIAQFSDPWADNPLERRFAANVWNRRLEYQAMPHMDAIIHSSAYTMNQMMVSRPSVDRTRFSTIGHCFDSSLFPHRKQESQGRLLIRFVGTLFGRRTPEPLFQAIARLITNRPTLADRICLELIGPVERKMLDTSSARSLPPQLVRHVPSVSYTASLQMMSEAHLLVLIEADVRSSLFLPSKFADYIGSRTPILALTSPGAAADLARQIGCWHAAPGDVEAIALTLENAIDALCGDSPAFAGYDNETARALSCDAVGQQFISIIERTLS